VEVSGELDMATVPTLECAAVALLSATPRLVLRLERTTFIDSSGYRLIQTLGERASSASGELTVIANSAPVQRLFELLGPPPGVRLGDGCHAGEAGGSAGRTP
jgi:anti-anti-sigma factor